jgi:hypothetical protein
VYLEDVASEIRTVKIWQRPRFLVACSNWVNTVKWDMVTANLKFEVSGQSQHQQLTFDWLIDSVTGQSVNTTHARLIG